MGQATGTGSFWQCPSCQKHVPSRQDTCQCGLERGQASKLVHEIRTGSADRAYRKAARKKPRIGAIGGALVMVAVLAVAGYWAHESWNASAPAAPEDSVMAQKVRLLQEIRERQRESEVVPAPVPARSPRPGASGPSGPSVGLGPAPVTTPAPPVTVTPGTVPPAATPVESEIDTKRRLGAEDFERAMIELSAKADRLDIAWNRFSAWCRREITIASGFAGEADREWFGVTVTQVRWTEGCVDFGTFVSLKQQVRDGMCVAEEGARRAWVLPGTRRDIRHRYRLDSSGWDTWCRF